MNTRPLHLPHQRYPVTDIPYSKLGGDRRRNFQHLYWARQVWLLAECECLLVVCWFSVILQNRGSTQPCVFNVENRCLLCNFLSSTTIGWYWFIPYLYPILKLFFSFLFLSGKAQHPKRKRTIKTAKQLGTKDSSTFQRHGCMCVWCEVTSSAATSLKSGVKR